MGWFLGWLSDRIPSYRTSVLFQIGDPLAPAGVLAPQRSDPTVHPLAFPLFWSGCSCLFDYFVCVQFMYLW